MAKRFIVAPDIQALRAALDYDPVTGLILWRANRCREKIGKPATGRPDSSGYPSIRFQRKRWTAHRLIWVLFYGALPSENIDHINGVPSDNRIVNLRLATSRQNNWNRRSINRTGIKGVTFHRGCRKWQAQIRNDGRREYLGLFSTPEEAGAAYAQKAKELFGEFARTG